jgi:hypothetical protein
MMLSDTAPVTPYDRGMCEAEGGRDGKKPVS